MRRAEISVGWLSLTVIVFVIGGIQVGLYMADWYDDGVAEPLSLWIGIVILLVAGALATLPFVRSSRSR
jgi:hypothetical protein